MADKKNVHDGHRERVRKEILANGFSESTPPHKILEMLLYYAIPRKDTNEIAHTLLESFGSVSGVFEAPAEELMKIKGVSENTASLLKLMIPVIRAYSGDKKSNPSLKNGLHFNSVYEFLENRYIGYKNEIFAITSFNHKGVFTGFDILAEGDNSEVKISIRQIIEAVIRRNASYAIISHNHPQGIAMPSSSDIEMTEKINTALKSIKVDLFDHMILTDDDYVSLRQSQSYAYLFE